MVPERENPHQGGSVVLVKMLLIDLCLITIAVASCLNGVIAFSLSVTFAAAIIKINKLDPEPFFLLSLHTAISCLMLHDAITTMVVIVAVAVTCMTTGSIEVSSERIAIFLISVALSSMLGNAATVITAIGMWIAIVAIRLRPLTPATSCVLCFLMLAASVPINAHVTAISSSLVAVVLTIWYLFWRLREKSEQLYLQHMEGFPNNVNNNNNNNNNYNSNSRLALMNGGHIKLCNTTDSLDLHGHTVTSALKSLHQFLKEHEDSYRENRTGHTRYLRVITGEDDKNHPEDSLNLIKPTVANFLKINKYRYQVNPSLPGIMKIDLESHMK